MRRIRWLGVGFLLLQFWLYRPPPGLTLPFPRWPVAIALASVLLLVNLVSLSVSRRTDVAGLRRWGLCALVVDSTVVLGIAWLFGFDQTSALWALLVIPVLEGAVRGQLRGALWTWAGVTAGFILRELHVAAVFPEIVFQLESITYRMGIVLIVAGTAGSLARDLTANAAAHRRAQFESEQRARLLHEVAETSRALLADQHAQAEPLWEAILDSAAATGFDGASISLFDREAHSYRVICTRGLPDTYKSTEHSLDSGISGRVFATDATVVIDDYTSSTHFHPQLRGLTFGATIAAPVRGSDGVAQAVLVLAYREKGAVTASEIEFVELLAAHAATALSNVQRLLEKQQYEQRLVDLAYNDPLTGLPNREFFDSELERTLARAATAGTRVAVLFGDLDRFKAVNDNLGHEAGDHLLTVIAHRLRGALRPGDLLARFGGDEFTVLIEHVLDDDHVLEIAERLQSAVTPALSLGSRELFPTMSIGIALSEPGSRGSDLVRDADVAMYRAKDRGRGGVEVFHPDLSLGSLRRFELEAELRRALERNEFTLHYQPIIALHDGAMIGVEALVRWQHPERGFLSPAEFIPLAEESGLIIKLGRWVLHEACRQVATWNRDGRYPVTVSVNLSVKQLQQEHFADEIESALLQSGLDPQSLLLEITESLMVTESETVLNQTKAISRLGVRLALDDFGRGFSSLSYLKDLPIDVLKIDRCFIAGIEDDAENRAIVRAVTQLAHDLGMTVTAEGIETHAQLAEVATLDCDHGQGYVLSRPMPPEAIDLLRGVPQPAESVDVVRL